MKRSEIVTVKTFVNEPAIVWGASERRMYQEALKSIKSEFNAQYPLIISNEEIVTEKQVASINPSNHKETIGYVCQANKEQIHTAVQASVAAFQTWGSLAFHERAAYLTKMANIIRDQKFELMAWLIYESGKNTMEAEGELNEAIDFLEMYAQGAIRLDKGVDVTPMAGVENEMIYLPLGVGAIIPPWNFPLAILIGLTASALVTGNTVVLKPSSSTPVVGAKFMEIVKEAELPHGVVNFVPGSSVEIGDELVSHRDVNFISFTGSMEAALHINERAHQQIPHQRWVKRLIAEMGGKCGIVVDETADLDKAADGIVVSAFSYQGQKCSAGSRAIIHEAIYDDLIDKIVERTKALTIGPSIEDTYIGPVIDEKAYKKIMKFIELGQKDATLVYGGAADNTSGYFIEPTIFKDADANSVIMQEEIFGPVLAICKVANYEEGMDVYNSTKYGLTGSFYTQINERMNEAKNKMVCGNLYINGKCTGAVVGVQPFGGYYMSGTGAKVGTPDFLTNFVQQKTISIHR